MSAEEQRYRRRNRALMIHWGVFLIVNILLFIINYQVNYENPWHFWVLVPWGAITLTHTAVVVITNLFDRTLETRLAIHASITIIMSAYLIWNDWFDDYRLEWVLFATVPLALVWLNHLIIYRILKPQRHKVTEDIIKPSIFTRMIDKEVDRISPQIQGDPRAAARKIVVNRIILRNHIIIYGLVNTFLFILNLYQGIQSPWFLWPTLSWGINILFHTFVYLNLKRKTLGQRLTMKYILVYPATIAVYLVIIDVLSNGIFDWFWWAVVPITVVSLLVAKIASNREIKKHHKMYAETVPEHAQRPRKRSSDNVHVQRITTASQRYCPKCGSAVLAHHRFCQSCGFELPLPKGRGFGG